MVSCPKFDIAHPKADCKGKGGDFLALGKKRLETREGVGGHFPDRIESYTDIWNQMYAFQWCLDGLLLYLSHLRWKYYAEILIQKVKNFPNAMQCSAVVPTTMYFSDCIALFHLFTRFCQSKGPNSFNSTAKTLTIGFNSNAKKEGEGAECSVACSDLTPTSGTLVWESSDQLKHCLLWLGRRKRVIKTKCVLHDYTW